MIPMPIHINKNDPEQNPYNNAIKLMNQNTNPTFLKLKFGSAPNKKRMMIKAGIANNVHIPAPIKYFLSLRGLFVTIINIIQKMG